MACNSRSSLADLKARMARFGAEWSRETGRGLTTARDGVDFLTAMKGRDDFWAALASGDPAAALPIDAAALRSALPSRELPREIEAEDCLRSIGLSESEIDAVMTGLDESLLLETAIRSAFAERTPQKIARALERVLDADRDVLATECYVGRLSESRGLGRSLGMLMGTAVLLIGTTLAGCGPQSAPTPPPSSTSQQTGTSPGPTTNSGSGTTTTPDTTTNSGGSGTTPTPDPTPNPTPPPVPAYKGVTPPRRRRALPRATSRTET